MMISSAVNLISGTQSTSFSGQMLNRSDWMRLREKIVQVRREHHLDDLIGVVELALSHRAHGDSCEGSGSTYSAVVAKSCTTGFTHFVSDGDLSQPPTPSCAFESMGVDDSSAMQIGSPTGSRLDSSNFTRSLCDGLKAVLGVIDEFFLETCSVANSRHTSAGSSHGRAGTTNRCGADSDDSTIPQSPASLLHVPGHLYNFQHPPRGQERHYFLVPHEACESRASSGSAALLEGSSTMTTTIGETTQDSIPDALMRPFASSPSGNEQSSVSPARGGAGDAQEHTVVYRSESVRAASIGHASCRPHEQPVTDISSLPHVIPVGRRRKSQSHDSASCTESRSASMERPVADVHVNPVVQSTLQQRQCSSATTTTLWRRGSVNSIASIPVSQRCPFQQTSFVNVRRDEHGVKWINDYALIGQLGRGSQGKVKLAERRHSSNPQKTLVAIKIFSRSPKAKWWRAAEMSALKRIEREVEIMKHLKHKNVVQLFEVIDDPTSHKMYLVMQYIEQGPICKLDSDGTCPCFPEERVAAVVRQIVTGLRYLHEHGVVHRDIKPENVLVGDHGRVYLADFGVAEMFERGDNPVVSGRIGTPIFFAPEMFDPIQQYRCEASGNNEGAAEDQAKITGLAAAVDVWALGITAYCLLFGRPPFGNRSNRLSLEDDVCFSELTIPTSRTVSSDAINFLRRVLDKAPEERISLVDLRKHPWLERHAPRSSRGEAATTPRQFSLLQNEQRRQSSSRQPSPLLPIETPTSDQKKSCAGERLHGLGILADVEIVPSPPRCRPPEPCCGTKRPTRAWVTEAEAQMLTPVKNPSGNGDPAYFVNCEFTPMTSNTSVDSCASPPSALRSTLPCMPSAHSLMVSGVQKTSSVSVTSGTDPHVFSKRNSESSLLSVDSNPDDEDETTTTTASAIPQDSGVSSYRRVRNKGSISLGSKRTRHGRSSSHSLQGRFRAAVFAVVFLLHLLRLKLPSHSSCQPLHNGKSGRRMSTQTPSLPPVLSPRKVDNGGSHAHYIGGTLG